MSKQLSKTTSRALASVLSSGAPPALITQTIGSLSLNRLELERRRREDLETALAALRSSWQRVPEARATIEKKASEIQEQLALIPERPTIRQAYRDNPVAITDDIVLLLCWLHEQVNITTGMNEVQMESCALGLIHTFPQFRLEDIAIIIRNAMAGQYGAIFNRIDVVVVSTWAQKYWAQLAEQRVARAYEKHASSKEDPSAPRGATTADEAFQKFRIQYLFNQKA